MQITDLWIRNFKSIRSMHIENIENALILVGQNNTGKTVVLDALRAVIGNYEIGEEDFLEDYPNIEIMVSLKIQEEDLKRFHKNGIVSTYRRYESWLRDFSKKLPSYREGTLCFSYIANREGKVRYTDGVQKNNPYIPRVMPNVYYLDSQRNIGKLQDIVIMLQEDGTLRKMRSGCCMFDQAKECNRCFSCIGLIHKKKTEDVKAHMEEIKIHMRGHNLYDIYYGRYKEQETELLTKYIEIAPREDFEDILTSIEQFIYFESRKSR